MNRTMNAVFSRLLQAQNIMVCGHIMPDGDCISSVVSLSMGLEKLGKKTIMAIDWKIPSVFSPFPQVGRIVDYSHYSARVEDPELLVIVDASSPDRIGRFERLLRYGVPSILIDHHATNTHFANLCWVEPSYSSTAQMIFDLLKLMEVSYDSDLALMNYIGIATDTGFFRYSNANSTVFEAAAELVKLGADPCLVATAILETRRLEEFFLERDAIDNLRLLSNDRFAYSYLKAEDFERYSLREDDFGGFVGDLRSIATVEVALFASESVRGEAHVSLRSKSYFDVSSVAVAFGGGGHPKAAGFTLKYDGDIEEALQEAVDFISRRLETHPKNTIL